jgi:hypothetical protein
MDKEHVAKMRRECRRLLAEARKTKDHEECGSILRRAMELATNAEILERKITRPKH